MVPKSYYIDTDALPWRESPFHGVRWKKLSFDRESGEAAVLLKFEPGASYGTHMHPAGEEYLVMEGSIEDDGTSYGPGTYVRHHPGSVHRPISKEGCLLFVKLPRPIEALEDPD